MVQIIKEERISVTLVLQGQEYWKEGRERERRKAILLNCEVGVDLTYILQPVQPSSTGVGVR